MNSPKDLEPSIIVCCVLECSICGWKDTYEGNKEDIEKAAEYFQNEGWFKDEDGIVVCWNIRKHK